MSSYNATPNKELQVYTQDDAAEIYITDASYNLVGHGLGRYMSFLLAPGIYTVKLRTGLKSREELVVLHPDETQPVVQRFEEAVRFDSPIPMVETSNSHEYHIDAAATESRKMHVKIGSGSGIFLFVRDWTVRGGPSGAKIPPVPNPAKGLTLRSFAGKVLVDISEQSAGNLDSLADQDPWRACHIELNPGTYRLNLELPTGDRLEQVIVAAAEWQTQVFALQTAYSEISGSIRSADLEQAAILMARSGFNPSDELIRLAELARLGLSKTRPVLRKDIFNMLMDKSNNPMLGIIGLYLMLRDPEFDRNQARSVIGNLRNLIGLHPDVEALAVAVGEGNQDYVFKAPPMLRESWKWIIEASAVRRELIPTRSLAGRVADRLWGEGPWLTWLSPSKSKGQAITAYRSRALRRDFSTYLSRMRPKELANEKGFSLRDPETLDKKMTVNLVQTFLLPGSRIEELYKSVKKK